MAGSSGTTRAGSRLHAGALTVALGLASIALACAPVEGPAPEPGSEDRLPPAHLEGVRFDGYRAGSREVQVLAARAALDPEGRTARLEKVEIRLADHGDGPVRVVAERGRVGLDGDDFMLEGEVRGTVGTDQQFTTSEVRYDAEQQRLWTDRPVSVTRSQLQLRGDGMEIDLEARRLRIRGRVRTHWEGRG